ncbi:hypothetical protein [Neobacillus niacini]|uniref:hypothetical protein n=1 Tax=Neobacillus niacini TaxID=86668 RepID=UPI000AEB6F78|nr:hypothetical protein [Neobacillus niacini]
MNSWSPKYRQKNRKGLREWFMKPKIKLEDKKGLHEWVMKPKISKSRTEKAS